MTGCSVRVFLPQSPPTHVHNPDSFTVVLSIHPTLPTFPTSINLTTMAPSEKEIREALDTVRDSEAPPLKYVQFLEGEMQKIWRRVLAKPDGYVMSDLEFAVFNHHRNRSEYQNSIAQKAVDRYWRNRSR